MSDPDQPSDQPEQPNQPRSKGHRFQKGHKFGKGRRPGAIGKKTLREKLLNGLAKSGAKKALKAGHNTKIDGFEFFIEHLADTNSSAAASLVSKLIPPETPPDTSGITPGVIVNVHSVAEGNMYAPGKSGVLLPYDECEKAWVAYKAGGAAWQVYLKEVEPQLTMAAFAKLSQVVPPAPQPDTSNDDQHTNVVPLRLLEAPIDQAFEPQTERERRLLAELEALSPEQLLERAKQAGFFDVDKWDRLLKRD